MAIYPNHNVPPLQPCFKHLKTISIKYPPEIDNCPAKSNDKQSM